MFDFLRRNPRNQGSSNKQIDKLVKRLTEPAGEQGPRIEAAERLADMGTPEATYALLKRFTISSKVITLDAEEKQYVVSLLVQKGDDAVEPIVRFLKSHHQVEWPVQALTEILSKEEWAPRLVEILESVAQNPFNSPEQRADLIRAMHGHVTPEIAETLKKSLDDDDDDVRIAAIEALAEVGEGLRETLLEAFLQAEDRPRVGIAVAEVFAVRDWAVKGYRPKVEERLPEGFHLTAKGLVRRRGAAE